jgi:restriction system protein
MWKITAGRANAYIADFLEGNVVGIGWMEAGDYRSVPSRDQLMELFAHTWPEHTNRQVQVGVGQVWRFLHEVAVGQHVLTYDPASRLYHLGEVRGEPQYEPSRMERLPVTRAVQWTAQVSRDDLSESTLNTLGSILTIYKLSSTAEREILQKSGVRVST